MSGPMIPTLDINGRKGYKAKVKRRWKDGGEYGSIAIHCTISHMIGQEDCLVILQNPDKDGGPLVNGHNIYKVLEHEELHHILQDILDNYDDDSLDQLLESLPVNNWYRCRLAFRIRKFD